MLEKQVSYSYCILEHFMIDDILAKLLTSVSRSESLHLYRKT